MPFSFKTKIELPSVAQLLTDGGDVRIQLDRLDGVNKYGCRPYPDNSLIALGSSTASTISESGYAAAEKLRDRLPSVESEFGVAQYTRELGRLRHELKALCGISDLAKVDIVFAASGTDAHLIAAQLADHAAAAPLCAVMVEAAETGSGVSAALAGRHFSSRTALGAVVTEAAPLAERAIVVHVVSIRLANGSPRSNEEIDAEITEIVSAAIALGQRVLLTLVDVSKTGLIAPSPACVARLHQAYAGQMTVLVDACQFRIAPVTLRAYLQCGYMVAITGSKFLTGPSFSGALFLPTSAQHCGPLPSALLNYSARADWPEQRRHHGLNDVANYGLLLRWEAALTEMRAFYAIPEELVREFMQEFADAILHRLQNDSLFQLLPMTRLDRHPLPIAQNWDNVPSIFSFVLYHGGSNNGNRVPLSREETMRIYYGLQQAISTTENLFDGSGSAALLAQRFQLGQPVLCGSQDNLPVSALRLCVSARSVAAATQSGLGAAGVIAQALAALDKIALLILAMR
ncbi:MAG: hypothetical protein ACYCSS_03445 [Sulfuriferula sp.]